MELLCRRRADPHFARELEAPTHRIDTAPFYAADRADLGNDSYGGWRMEEGRGDCTWKGYSIPGLDSGGEASGGRRRRWPRARLAHQASLPATASSRHAHSNKRRGHRAPPAFRLCLRHDPYPVFPRTTVQCAVSLATTEVDAGSEITVTVSCAVPTAAN